MINSLGHQEPGASPSSREDLQMVEPGSGCLAAARVGAALRAGGSHGRRRERESARAFHLPEKTFQAEDPVSRDSEVSRCETQISKWAGACAPPPPSRRSGAVGRLWGPARLRRLPRGGALWQRPEPWGPRTWKPSPISTPASKPGAHRGSWREGTAEKTRAKAWVRVRSGYHRPLAEYLALVMR